MGGGWRGCRRGLGIGRRAAAGGRGCGGGGGVWLGVGVAVAMGGLLVSQIGVVLLGAGERERTWAFGAAGFEAAAASVDSPPSNSMAPSPTTRAGE